jgi:hypothetical protein
MSRDRKLIFVSAQPDVPYFHWQCEVYLSNFINLGISPEDIYVLFATSEGENLSEGAEKLKKYTSNILSFPDNRNKKHYIPSIKPYLICEFLKKNPELGDRMFVHDSDIVFNFLPNFEILIDDDIQYLSDTNGYLNFDYIMSCDSRYSKKHQDVTNGLLLREMVDVIGIDIGDVKKNNLNSGGAQYLLKNQTWFIWYKIYKDSTVLYDRLKRFHTKYPIEYGEIQFWTAEMWSILWNLWWWNQETKVVDELKFCWATDSIDKCSNHPILHMAGITEDLKNDKFYKGDFIEVNPLQKLLHDSKFFDYISPSSATQQYINQMKKIIEKISF